MDGRSQRRLMGIRSNTRFETGQAVCFSPLLDGFGNALRGAVILILWVVDKIGTRGMFGKTLELIKQRIKHFVRCTIICRKNLPHELDELGFCVIGECFFQVKSRYP